MSMHNLDAIHGDEHLGKEFTQREIKEIELAFWRGELWSVPSVKAEVAFLLTGDEDCEGPLLDICTLDLSRPACQLQLIAAVHRLRRRASHLVQNQILEGNIRGNDMEDG